MQTRKRKSRKRRILCVLLGIVFLILAGAALLAYFQYGNLKAVQMMKYTPEEQQALLVQNENTVQQILEQLPVEAVKPLDEEQEAMLQSGAMSEEEALDLIMGRTSESTKDSPSAVAEGEAVTASTDLGQHEASVDAVASEAPQATAAPTEAKQEETSTLQEKVARVYLLRSTFTGQLNALIGEAKQEYYATPQEQRNTVALGKKYLGRGQALEKQCDAQMEVLLADVATELERVGGDTSLVSQMRDAYQEQKSIKKAELLSQYLIY